MGKKFSQAKTSIADEAKWEDDLPFDMVDIRNIAKGEHHPIRLVGVVEPFMRFWVPIEASKAYDPFKTKCKMYPSVCVDFDPVEETFKGNECLYSKAHYEYIDKDSGEKKWGKLKPSKNYVIFFIDRERQEEREGISLEKKVKMSKKHSDIQCAVVPTAFAKAVQNVIDLYAKKVKKTVDPTDPEEGYDLFFKFDPEANAEAKYTCQLGDPSPLTKDELKQVALVPESVNIYPKDSPERIRESLLRHGYVIVENGEDPEEAKAAQGGGKKSSKKKGTMKAGAELLDDDDDEEEDEAPRRRSNKADKADDVFEDEEDDLNEESSTPSVSLEDDNDEEEEEEAPAPKKKEKKKSVKKATPPPVEDDAKDDDDDDDDDDFDWEDDD